MSGITGHGSMTTRPTSNHVAAIRNTETLTTEVARTPDELAEPP